MRLRFVAALVAMSMSACASVTLVPRAPDEGGPTWSRGESAHLDVETDLGPSGARELAHDLESWRLAMTTALFEHARPPRERLEVIALRIGELATLNPTLQGAFGRLSRDEAPTLVLGPDRPDQRTEIMRHELAHAVIGENLNGVPRWLNEGMASLLATADLDESTGLVTWGRLEIHDAHISHYDLAPLDDLLDDVWPAFDIAKFEFSAAYLARMLAREHPRELKCLLEHLAGTDGYDAALAACFPDRRAWSVEYAREQFRQDENVGSVRLGAPSNDAAVTVRPMSDAEVHGALARLDDIVAHLTPMGDERRTELQDAADRQRARARALGALAPSPSTQ
jgi:hypothetical protein